MVVMVRGAQICRFRGGGDGAVAASIFVPKRGEDNGGTGWEKYDGFTGF